MVDFVKALNQKKKHEAGVFNTHYFTCEIDGIEVELEFQVTAWGSPDSWYEPGDPPEWVVWDAVIVETGIHLALDHPLIEKAEVKLGEADFSQWYPEPDYD